MWGDKNKEPPLQRLKEGTFFVPVYGDKKSMNILKS